MMSMVLNDAKINQAGATKHGKYFPMLDIWRIVSSCKGLKNDNQKRTIFR